MRCWYNTLYPELHYIKKLFLKNLRRRIWGFCKQMTICVLSDAFLCSASSNPKSSQTGSRQRNLPIPHPQQSLTFWASYFRQVGELLVAIVALAAAEKDLRVFFCGYTLLPASGRDTHSSKGKRKTTSANLRLQEQTQTSPKSSSPRALSCWHSLAGSAYRKLSTHIPRWIAKTLEKAIKEKNASICTEDIRW